MRQANTTFVNLRATLDDVDPLVAASMPVAQRLGPFFREFRAAAADAVPTIRDLDAIVRRKGKANDLVELTRLQVPLAEAGVGSGAPDCGDDPTRRRLRPARRRRGLHPGLARRGGLRAHATRTRSSRTSAPTRLSSSAGSTASRPRASSTPPARSGASNSTFNTFSIGDSGLPDLLSPIDLGDSRTGFEAAGFDVGNDARCPGANERDPGDGSTPFTDDGDARLRSRPGPAGPMRRIAFILALAAAGASVCAASVSADEETHTYKLEMFNAFGLVEGSEVKVAGVNAGTVESLEVSEDKTALVEVKLTGPLAVLGEDTQCSSEPQSLIAEYFIDCQPAGAPAEDGAILDKKVTQTVQPDLVQNTLREPFKDRLAMLINEFGTALSGNPENLNEAIRLGAPALEDLHAALRLLGRQNTVIRDLNVDSDRIIWRPRRPPRGRHRLHRERGRGGGGLGRAQGRPLAPTSTCSTTSWPSSSRRWSSSENVARETTPLLADLRGAAPQLNELATSLPAFNRATPELARLARQGGQAWQARAPPRRPARAPSRRSPTPARRRRRRPSSSKDFARDIDDPRRIVEIDDRAAEDLRGRHASLLQHRPRRPDRLHGPRGPPQLRLLPGGLDQPVRQRRAPPPLHALRRLHGPCGSLQRAARLAAPERGSARGRRRGHDRHPLEAANCVSVPRAEPARDHRVRGEHLRPGARGSDLRPSTTRRSAAERRRARGRSSSADPATAPAHGAVHEGLRRRRERRQRTPDGARRPAAQARPSPTLPDLPGADDLPVDPDSAAADDIRDILDDLPGGLGKNGKKAASGNGRPWPGRRRRTSGK